jgi:hypothetical protein
MPIHDWTTVKAGTFHNFHVLWTSSLTNRLNAGLLPTGFFAMAEQVIGGPEPDVVSLHTRSGPRPDAGGVAVGPSRPKATFVMPVQEEKARYARKANQIAIHHELGHVVAVIEIVSPGNKDSRHAARALVQKAGELIFGGVNLLVIDLFPPGTRDPQGVHGLIWDEITDQPPFELPPGKPLTVAAYQAAPTRTAYVEPVAVGDRLPDMPLFLYEEGYVNVPLEETYETTWNALPVEIRALFGPQAQA